MSHRTKSKSQKKSSSKCPTSLLVPKPIISRAPEIGSLISFRISSDLNLAPETLVPLDPWQLNPIFGVLPFPPPTQHIALTTSQPNVNQTRRANLPVMTLTADFALIDPPGSTPRVSITLYKGAPGNLNPIATPVSAFIEFKQDINTEFILQGRNSGVNATINPGELMYAVITADNPIFFTNAYVVFDFNLL